MGGIVGFNSKITLSASTGINSKCSDGDSDDRTCDTQAANKCWTLNGATSKVIVCIYAN